jgi:hypothetical protein
MATTTARSPPFDVRVLTAERWDRLVTLRTIISDTTQQLADIAAEVTNALEDDGFAAVVSTIRVVPHLFSPTLH